MTNIKAFTLAEILITMGIVGIVATLTIPALVKEYQTRQWNTAKTSFNRTFGEALKIMNSQETLAKYTTTEDFVTSLEKYYKIVTICDIKPTACFSETILWGDEDKEIDMTKKLTAKDIVDYADGEEDWGTNVVGLQFANGVSALLAYNPKCEQNKYDGNTIQITGSISNGKNGTVSFSTNNCLAMIYDINGNGNPNKNSKDLTTTSNVRPLDLLAIINGVKITKVASSGSYDPVDYTKVNDSDYQYCDNHSWYSKDMWAGAVKFCGGKEKIATYEDLVKIAQYLYDNNNVTSTRSSMKHKDEFIGYGFPSGEFGAWTPTNTWPHGLQLYFHSQLVFLHNEGRTGNGVAVCVQK